MTLDNDLICRDFLPLVSMWGWGKDGKLCFIGVCLVCDFMYDTYKDGRIKKITTELNIDRDSCLRYYILLKILYTFSKVILENRRLVIGSHLAWVCTSINTLNVKYRPLFKKLMKRGRERHSWLRKKTMKVRKGLCVEE